MDDDHAALWAAESAACEPTEWSAGSTSLKRSWATTPTATRPSTGTPGRLLRPVEVGPHTGRGRRVGGATGQRDRGDAGPARWPLKPPARRWLRGGALVVLLASAGGAVAFLLTAPSADCRTVRAAVSYIHDRRDLVADTRIDSGPALNEYVSWADTLQRYAESTSSPQVRPDLDAIALRARHAMGLVSLARTTPAPIRPANVGSPVVSPSTSPTSWTPNIASWRPATSGEHGTDHGGATAEIARDTPALHRRTWRGGQDGYQVTSRRVVSDPAR